MTSPTINTAGEQRGGIANIKPFKFRPGVSGNPSGRPPGSRNLSSVIRSVLETEADFKRLPVKDATRLEKLYKGATIAQIIAYVQACKAIDGDPRAAEFLARNGGNPALLSPLDNPMAALTAEALDRQARIYDAGQKAIAAEREEAKP